MKILIFGAGVIGKVYASQLLKSGVDVTLLARGENYELIKQQGVKVKNILTGETATHKIPVIAEINPNENYDLIIVTVRLDQLEAITHQLNEHKNTKTTLFMLNNIQSREELQQQFPDKEIILGFPGIGGSVKNNEVEYHLIKQQKTTLGCADGTTTELLSSIKAVFEKSGFETEVEKNMEAWLKTHAVFITCLSATILKQNGNNVQLSNDKKAVQEMIYSIEEGFKGLQKLGITITPGNLKTIFMTMPKWFSVMYWRKALKGDMGSMAISKPEMKLLAENVLDLLQPSSAPTPMLRKLLSELTV